MALGLLLLMVVVGGVFGLITLIAWLDNDLNGLCPLVLLGAAVVGIVGSVLYGIADDRVETELYVGAEMLGDDTQYIQYDHPDHEYPVVVNVNQRFGRVMSEYDMIRVTIYSEGPYNGVYGRPSDKLEIVDIMDTPPAPPSDYNNGPRLELRILPGPYDTPPRGCPTRDDGWIEEDPERDRPTLAPPLYPEGGPSFGPDHMPC